MKNLKTKIKITNALIALLIVTQMLVVPVTTADYTVPCTGKENVDDPNFVIAKDVGNNKWECTFKDSNPAQPAPAPAPKPEPAPATTPPSSGSGQITPNFNLTEGTFNVIDNLTLDNGDQAKKYFSKDPNAPSPIVSLVLTFINFAITIMGSIAVILFIVAGFMFMTAQGNPQKLDEAKDIIKYAAIGLLVALLSYVITIFVQSIFSNG